MRLKWFLISAMYVYSINIAADTQIITVIIINLPFQLCMNYAVLTSCWQMLSPYNIAHMRVVTETAFDNLQLS